MPSKIFYSYSHKDEQYRKELETHLAILRKNGFISEWHDRCITAGSEWEEDIDLNIDNSDIILLLVSSNFLASDYCYDTETIRAIDMHVAKEAVVIPILLKPCLWLETKLKKLQAIPRDNKPISKWDNEDEAWLEVSKEILEVVKKNRKKEANISAHSKPKDKKDRKNEAEEVIENFLLKYRNWYFSPLRIQKWGSRQDGFSTLSQLSTGKIRAILVNLVSIGRAKTTISQKGNIIYKII